LGGELEDGLFDCGGLFRVGALTRGKFCARFVLELSSKRIFSTGFLQAVEKEEGR
jgi:hypothetical protein